MHHLATVHTCGWHADDRWT